MCSLWSADPPYSGHLSPMRSSSVLQPALMASAAAKWAWREVSGAGSEAAREGVLVVWVWGRGFFLVSRPPPSQWARVLLRGPAARSGGRALILSRRAHRIEMPRGSPASSSELEFWLASHGQWLVLSRFIKKYYKLS